MLARHYAQALLNLKEKAAAEGLLGVLAQKGHMALLPTILSEYHKIKEGGKREIRAIARIKSKDALVTERKHIEHYERQLGFSLADTEIVEDPSIVGGFVIEFGEREVDGSYRSKLVGLFRKMMSVSV